MPQQPGQGVRSDQRCAQEEHGAIQVAEEEEETQGKDISVQVRPRQPGLRDAEETQDGWKKKVKYKRVRLTDQIRSVSPKPVVCQEF